MTSSSYWLGHAHFQVCVCGNRDTHTHTRGFLPVRSCCSLTFDLSHDPPLLHVSHTHTAGRVTAAVRDGALTQRQIYSGAIVAPLTGPHD